MLSSWFCKCPPSVVRVRTYSCHDFVRGFSCYRPDLVRDHHQVSEFVCIFTWSLSGLTVEYQNLDMSFTECHSDRDIRTIYLWNEISQFSINCIPIIYHQINIYYIHDQLYVLIVNYRLRIPLYGSRCFPILTIDCIDPVHMQSQDLLLYLWWDTFPLFE